MEAGSTAGRERVDAEERRTERALLRPMQALRRAHTAHRSRSERLADASINLVSSPGFLLGHLVWFTLWIGWNARLLGVEAMDPFPFGLLTMIVSLEAICLSLLLLLGQKRESRMAELREELTLQINLRIEAEVTKGLQLVAGLYTRLGHRFSNDDELREMLQAMDPQRMERELAEQIENVAGRG